MSLKDAKRDSEDAGTGVRQRTGMNVESLQDNLLSEGRRKSKLAAMRDKTRKMQEKCCVVC